MPMTTADYTMIVDLVRRRSGIVIEPGKEYLVEMRLANYARHNKLAGAEFVLAEMRKPGLAGEAMRSDFVEAMTTNETSFFRDAYPFEALKAAVLPTLLAARSATKTLNVWCAASSTGQEPYTIAMVLAEHFPQLLTSWRLTFVATDLSTDVLDRARAGKFTANEVGRGLPPALLAKHFVKTGPTEYQVSQRLRNLIEFKQLNLVGTWPTLPALDLIFIRNVLIYFDTPTKSAILHKARSLMRQDGFLFLGGAETTMNLDDGFERLSADRSGCYRIRSVHRAAKAA